MKRKIKRYIDCYVPITTCNLRCSYCYVAQQGLFKQAVPHFEHVEISCQGIIQRKVVPDKPEIFVLEKAQD